MPTHPFACLRARLAGSLAVLLAALACLFAAPVSAQTVSWVAADSRTPVGTGDCGIYRPVPGRAMVRDAVGNVYVTGCATFGGRRGQDIVTAKFDSGGTLLWQRHFSGGEFESSDYGYAITIDDFGNLVVAGASMDTPASTNRSARVIRYDASNGRLIWTRSIPAAAGDAVFLAIAQDASSGDVVATGFTTNAGAGRDILTMKFRISDGATRWTATQAGTAAADDIAYAVALDASGNALVAGTTVESDSFGSLRVTKYAASTGAQSWTASYNGAGEAEDVAYAIALDGAGNAIATGQSREAGGDRTIRTVKFAAANGAQLWTAGFNGSAAGGDDAGHAVAIDAAGDVYVTGRSQGTGTGTDLRVLKYGGSTGAQSWTASVAGPGTETAEGNAITTLGTSVIVAGRTTVSGTDTAGVVVRLNASTGAINWTAAVNDETNGAGIEYGLAIAPGTTTILVNAVDATGESYLRVATADFTTGTPGTFGRTSRPSTSSSPGGGNEAARRSAALDAQGNLVVAGTSSDGASGNNFRVIKYQAATGYELWNVALEGAGGGNDAAQAMTIDAAGHVVVTGFSFDATGGFNMRTVKFDGLTGAVLWSTAYAGSDGGIDFARAIALDAAGNAYVTGYSTDTGQGENFRVVKYDGATGAQLWTAAYNGSAAGSADGGYAIAIGADGHPVATGYATETAGGRNIRTIKLDSATGAILWSVQYNGAGNNSDEGRAVAIDAFGRVFVAGFSHEGASGEAMRVLRLDGTSGNTQWTVAHEGTGTGPDRAHDLVLDASGAAYVTGFVTQASGGADMRTLKLDGTTGNVLWSATFGGAGGNADQGNALALNEAGEVVVTGTSTETGPSGTLRTIKYAGATGSVVWNHAYPGDGSLERGHAVVTQRGAIYVAGVSSELNDIQGIVAIRFDDRAPTTTTVVPSANPSPGGAPITFTVNVTGVSPTGTVTLTRDGVVLFGCPGAGTMPLSAGTAQCTVSLVPGTRAIVATYSGDSGNLASVSPTLSQVVDFIPQAITFTSSPPSGAFPGSPSYTVAATGGASGLPVVFSIDAASTPGACSVAGAVVSFTGTGTCLVNANQAGSAFYSAAPQVQQSITVSTAPASFTLAITNAEATRASVTSSPAGVACGAICSVSFATGTVVTLTASPGPLVQFDGWSGEGCTGTGTCIVTMNAARNVTANFSAAPISQFALSVTRSGAGTGAVTSNPAGINCGAACNVNFNSGVSIALTATPAADSFFNGWSGGGCSGTGACNVTMDAAKSVNAEFKLNSSIPRLANISTRMQVLTGADVLIGGFIIGGSQAKTVVIRARGPSLIPLGVPNALANPVLQLFSGATQIDANDNWQQAANQATIFSSGFAPSDPLESAIYTTLNPGAYTAIVTGANLGTGVAIIEVFEVDKPEVPLLNIATRGKVLTGGDVMIGGFIIQGDAPQTVVVRARGPSLEAQGVPGSLQDTVLQLFSGQAVIASNDDWQTSPDAATIQTAGFAPSDTRESVIRITLNPGAYTAIVTGKNGTTGVGIIEVFAQ